MDKINKIIVHCADTYAAMDIGADTIRSWHVNERKWSDIGYHYVIRRNGTIENGRDDNIAGAHARDHNGDSLGVCLVGGKGEDNNPEFNFTAPQIMSLIELCSDLTEKYNCEVIGHNEVSDKSCPNFNVQEFFG